MCAGSVASLEASSSKSLERQASRELPVVSVTAPFSSPLVLELDKGERIACSVLS